MEPLHGEALVRGRADGADVRHVHVVQPRPVAGVPRAERRLIESLQHSCFGLEGDLACGHAMTIVAPPTHSPRPDAQPLPWGELSEEQKTCLLRLVGALHGSANSSASVDEAEQRRGLLHLVPIDASRWSNIYLIDGARGSGKTTVLLMFLKACMEALRGEPLAAELTAVPEMNVLRGHLLPTPILDLQPLPLGAPLITWIAMRVLEVLDAAEADFPAARRAPSAAKSGRWEPGYIEESEARRAWRNLVEVIAGGWDGNLAERKSKLDPEAWAIELTNSERERLTLQRCWRQTINLLLQTVHETHRQVIHRDVRLVVPIDDADMNPQRCVELLEMLRVLWHPRVVFILTGDTELFRTTLRLYYEGVLRKVAGGVTLGEQAARDVVIKAGSLQHQVFDKVIPRGHQFPLKRLEPRERMHRVVDCLAAIQVEVMPELGAVTLATYLQHHEWLGHALPPYPRPLQELREALRGEDAVSAALCLWQLACEADDLAEAECARIERSERGLNVDLSRIGIVLRDTRVSGDRRAIFHSRTRAESMSDKGQAYSERTMATLLLCASIAGDLAQNPAPNAMSFTPSFQPVFAAGAQEDDEGQWLFAWPVPAWTSPADVEAFAQVWQRTLDACGATSTDDAAQLFIRAVIAAGRAERGTLPSVEALGGEGSWTKTVEILAACFEGVQSVRSLRLREWAILGAPLFCAPESGLTAQHANALLRWWNEVWANAFPLHQHLRQLREARARLVWPNRNVDVAERLRMIDLRQRDHAWASTVLGEKERRVHEVRVWLGRMPMPWGQETVAGIADELNLVSALTTTERRREDEGRLNAAMSVSPEGSTPETMAAIWRAMVSHLSLGGPAMGERQRIVRVEGQRLLVRQERNATGSINQNRAAQVPGDQVYTRGAGLSAPPDHYARELQQYALGSLPQSLASSFTTSSRAMLVLCRDVAAAFDDDLSTASEFAFADFKWIRRNVPPLNEVWTRAPAWPMLYDEVRLLRMWLEATNAIWSTLTGVIELDQFEAAVGAFIECVLALYKRRDATPTMTTASDEAYWRRLAERVASVARRPPPLSRRARAVWHWSRVAVPLLAAPEGMLCATTGTWLLDGFDDTCINRDAMHSLRREHVIRVVGAPADRTDPKARATDFLAQLARAEPDNPWIERFGETQVTPDGDT